MKKLYLIRHAKSSWDNNNLKDIERPLNKRGEKDAPFMGTVLSKKNIKPDFIISSPAERALTTAKIFCSEMKIDEDQITVEQKLYEASRKDILSVIQSFDKEINSAMLFSHNPGLTDLAGFLTSGEVYDIPTCGIVSINSKVSNWTELNDSNCEMEFFEYPKKHSK